LEKVGALALAPLEHAREDKVQELREVVLNVEQRALQVGYNKGFADPVVAVFTGLELDALDDDHAQDKDIALVGIAGRLPLRGVRCLVVKKLS